MPKPALERPTKATEEPSVSVQPVGGKTIALEERSVAAISQTLEKSASSSAGKAVVADAATASKSIAKTASQAAPLAGELKEPAPGRPRIGGGPSLASAVHGEAQIQAAQNKGAALGIAAGLLAGFALDKYREWMRESLAAMPPIEIGREPLGEYLKSSPAAMNMIGLLAKDINGFAANVEKTSQTVLYNAAGRTLAIRLSQYSRARRIELLRQVDESVGAFWGELVQARAGIEGALALESQGQQTIAAATDLAEMILKPSPTIGNAMVWDFLVKQGFLIEEIMQMHGNLESYARAIRGLFRRLHDLHDLIEGTIREVGSFGSELNRLWWAEVLTQAREQGAESNSP